MRSPCLQGDVETLENIRSQNLMHLVINHRYKNGQTLLQLAAALGRTLPSSALALCACQQASCKGNAISAMIQYKQLRD